MDLIELLKAKNKLIHITLTGGGSLFISDLLSNGGASSVFLGATIPYHAELTKSIFKKYSYNKKRRKYEFKKTKI